MLLPELLDKLQKVKAIHKDSDYLALCPAHADREPSLYISLAEDCILLKCFAGCQTEAIIEALGLKMSDLFLDSKHDSLPTKSEIVATYDYLDEQGHQLFQVVRYKPKDFRQRHKNGAGEWIWNLDGVRRVLYHLFELQQVTDETVYFVEGEKDADNIWSYGGIATTSPGGANNWKPEYADYLTGKRIVIIPDKDSAGFNYARQVAISLQGKVREVKTIILPQVGVKDISDWLEQGGDFCQLPSLEQDVSVLFESEKPKYERGEDCTFWLKPLEGHALTFKAQKISEEKTGIHARINILLDSQMLAWSYFNVERSEDRTRLSNSAHQQIKSDMAKTYNKEDLRVDLDNFCSGLWEFEVAGSLPEMTAGDEEVKPINFLLNPYVTEGGGTILFAPPGRGKSNSALLWAISIDAGINKFWTVTKTPILFINLERSRQSLRRRIALINKVLDLPSYRPLLLLNARGKSLSNVMPACRKAIKQYGVKCIFLDSISRAGYGDLNENRPVNAIIDALSSLCDTWVALAHTPRANEEHIFGGIHFDAGADIVVQLSSQIAEDGTLGIGYLITKSNDVPIPGQRILAFEFNELGLTAVRPARPSEFPEVEGKRKISMVNEIMDFIANQDSGEASAIEIEKELGFNRVNISKALNHSGKFIKTRKEGREVFYGVKENREERT